MQIARRGKTSVVGENRVGRETAADRFEKTVSETPGASSLC